MGKKRNPRAIKPKDLRPCRRCQTLIPVDRYEESNHLCPPCWRQEWQEHQAYVRQNAIIIAEVGVGFTADLFSSELVIELDGGYFHTVRWHDPQQKSPFRGEHLGSFASDEWANIGEEAETLHAQHSPARSIMDDLETYSVAICTGQSPQWMELQGEWHCSDAHIRFCKLWNRIHQDSPWFSRLALKV